MVYNPDIDYKTKHLYWIKANRAFRPRSPIPPGYSSYYEFMIEFYHETIKQNKTAYLLLMDDYNWSIGQTDINKEVADLFGKNQQCKDDNSYFVTISLNPEAFNSVKVLAALNKFNEKSYVLESYAVFEFHTENGGHPHIHLKITMDKYKQKSKVLQKISESPLGKFVMSKNFIDVKRWEDYHQEYIELDKRPEKKVYLDADIEWRKKNNLPEYVKK